MLNEDGYINVDLENTRNGQGKWIKEHLKSISILKWLINKSKETLFTRFVYSNNLPYFYGEEIFQSKT